MRPPHLVCIQITNDMRLCGANIEHGTGDNIHVCVNCTSHSHWSSQSSSSPSSSSAAAGSPRCFMRWYSLHDARFCLCGRYSSTRSHPFERYGASLTLPRAKNGNNERNKKKKKKQKEENSLCIVRSRIASKWLNIYHTSVYPTHNTRAIVADLKLNKNVPNEHLPVLLVSRIGSNVVSLVACAIFLSIALLRRFTFFASLDFLNWTLRRHLCRTRLYIYIDRLSIECFVRFEQRRTLVDWHRST